jgi:hypothetical protein
LRLCVSPTQQEFDQKTGALLQGVFTQQQQKIAHLLLKNDHDHDHAYTHKLVEHCRKQLHFQLTYQPVKYVQSEHSNKNIESDIAPQEPIDEVDQIPYDQDIQQVPNADR